MLKRNMCKVYNTVGSLKTIKEHLAQRNIDGFKSINELISFQDNYSTVRQQIVSNQKTLIAEEKNNLSSGILQLENELTNNKIEIQKKLQSKLENLERQLDVI